MFGADLLGTVFYPILFTIDAFAYKAFSLMYSLYITLAKTTILTDTTYKTISSRITVIVGVIALFMVSYTLIQNIINPDDKKGENGLAIVKKIVIAFVVVIIIPVGFNFMYGLQDAILSGNVISNLINGASIDTESIGYIQIGIDTDGDDEYDENHYVCSSCDSSLSYEECYASGDTVEVSLISDDELSDSDVCNDSSVKFEVTSLDVASVTQETAGNKLALTILEGFIHPVDGLEDSEVEADIGDYIGSSTKGGFLAGLGICALAVGGSAIFTIVTAGFGAVSWGAAGIACASIIGASTITGLAYSGMQVVFFLDNPTWEQFKIDAIALGDFGNLVPFSSLVGDKIDYLSIISSIAAVFLCIMMANFILDMAVRIVKLAFYHIIAPVPAFLSILPNNSDLLKTYFKAFLTVYVEVFIRVLCLALIGFFAGILYELTDLGFFTKAIVMFGIISLLKEFPKMFSEVTGIKSEGMSFGLGGLKERLGNGGVFAAGSAVRSTGLIGSAVIGGGTKSFAQSRAVAAEHGKGKFNTFKDVTMGSLSGAVKSGYNVRKAKSVADMKVGVNKGAQSVSEKLEKKYSDEERYGMKNVNHMFEKGFRENRKKYKAGKKADRRIAYDNWLGSNSTEAVDKQIELMTESIKFKDDLESTKVVSKDSKVQVAQAAYDSLTRDYTENIKKIINENEDITTEEQAKKALATKIEGAYNNVKTAKKEAINTAYEKVMNEDADADPVFASMIEQRRTFLQKNVSNAVIKGMLDEANKDPDSIVKNLKANNDIAEKQLSKLKSDRAKIINNNDAVNGSN